MTICYPIDNKLYINLTNRCNNNCVFCVRRTADGVSGHHLFLESEPTVGMVMEDISRFDLSRYVEIVYCGFGEPTLALDVLLETARRIREISKLPIRINTNGLSNLYYKEDITPRFQGLIDIVSISLNAKSAEEYEDLCQSDYGMAAFNGLLNFAEKCKAYVGKVIFTVVDVLPEDDIAACREIAEKLGVTLRVRSMIQ